MKNKIFFDGINQRIFGILMEARRKGRLRKCEHKKNETWKQLFSLAVSQYDRATSFPLKQELKLLSLYILNCYLTYFASINNSKI